MARKKNKTTELDWTKADEGGGGSFKIPEGDYRMRFSEVERDESKDGNDMLVWDFIGLESKAKKKKFRIWTSLLPEALWKLGNLLDAMGIDRPESVEEIIEAVEAEDPAPEIIGIVTDEEYNNKTSSKVTDFTSTDGASEDEEEGKGGKKNGKKGKEKDEAPDFDDMDEDDLAKFVKKNKLDVDLDDYKTIKKKRAAVAEAHEAGDEGDDDDKVSKETVNEADEDDLAALNKEHKLKVDLDDHRTIKKKRAAILEALEEKDLLAEEEEEDEGDKRRGGKGGKGGKEAELTEDEVKEMDGDELEAVLKKHKVKGVDLDDHGTLKKKRAAVIEALQEKGVIAE